MTQMIDVMIVEILPPVVPLSAQVIVVEMIEFVQKNNVNLVDLNQMVDGMHEALHKDQTDANYEMHPP
jgi:hypothetical protein